MKKFLSSAIDLIGRILFPFRPESLPVLEEKLRYIVSFLQNIAFLGLLSIIVLHLGNSPRDAALGLLTSLAFFVAGSLAGVILGLPRIAADNVAAKNAQSGTTDAPQAARQVSPIAFNNNLVDISDWITKAILTLTLANAKLVIPYMKGAAAYLAFHDSQAARIEAMVIMIGYSSVGILYGYITTRTLLTELLIGAGALNKDLTRAVEDAGRTAVKTLDAFQGGDEPRRVTEAITPEEKNAARQIASQTSALPMETIKSQLEQLAIGYSEVRANQMPGGPRTAAMEEIAGKMRALALSAIPLLPQLKTSDKAGLRLAAVSILEMKPDPSQAEWLVERLSTESPFIGYHAAIALREAVNVLDCKDKGSFLSQLEAAKNSVPPVSDRAQIIADAIRKVAEKCPS